MKDDFASQFEEEYSKIKILVHEAKDYEVNHNLHKAKSRYLDAASYTLELSKRLEDIESITFRNIARMLVDTAKEIQMLINIERDPLPNVPGTISKSLDPQDPLLQRKQLHLRNEENREITKVGDPDLLQMMIIKTSGIPIFSWVSDKMSSKTQSKINDILFSGAITAVNSLISEVLSTPIQSINFEEGNILLKFVDDLMFVLYCEGDQKLLEDNLQAFSTSITGEVLPKWEQDLKRGLSLNNNPEVLEYLHSNFIIEKE